MATMKDVADLAGVSVATVSRVINQNNYVSSDLVERVLDAMATLNYQPDKQSLRRERTRTIGVLLPHLNQPFFSALAFAIEKTLFEQEHHTFICSSEGDPQKEAAYIEMFIRRRIDGVILVASQHSAACIEKLQAHRVPVVLVDRDLPSLRVNRVLSDNLQGGYDGMSHLLGLGHRRIGIIGAPMDNEATSARMNGIKKALADVNRALDPNLVIIKNRYTFQQGYAAAKELLEAPNRPTAIFALTDVIAIGVMHAASEIGLLMPDNLSIVGFDNISLAAYSIPELTTVAQPIYEMGHAAAGILLRHIAEDDAPIETILLETALIVRKSTAAPG